MEKTNETEKPKFETPVSMDFNKLTTTKVFKATKVGSPAITFQVKDIKKMPAMEFNGKKIGLSKADYYYEIECTDGEFISVNSWGLWAQLKAVMKTLREQGAENWGQMQFNLYHPAQDTYEVSGKVINLTQK